MKKRFTRILAALALLAILAIPLGMWGQTTVTYKLTIDASYFNTTSYAANNNEKTTNAICTTDNTKTYEVHWTSYQVMKNGNNMQWQKGKGYIYNSTDLGTITNVTVTSSAGSFTTYYGTSEQPSSGSSGQGKGFFKTSVGNDATGTTSKMEVTFQIVEGGSTPSLSVSPSSIDFGLVAINPSSAYTKTFAVTFANLTQNLSVSVGSGLTGVSVNPTTILTTDSSPATVTVSYTPTTAGNLSGNITVGNTDDNLSKTVAVTGSAYDPANVDTYELYTGNIVEGDYVIYDAFVAMKNEIVSNRFANQDVEPDDDQIINPANSIIWHIAPSGNYWTIYNAAVEKYAGGTSTKNQGALLDDPTDILALWTISYNNTDGFVFHNYGRSQSSSDSGNAYLRHNGNSGWATYTATYGAAPILYKKVNANQVAMPTFTVEEGTYYETKTVGIECGTQGASIQYKLSENGEWQTYTEALIISETTTVWAKATKTGMTESDVASATYTILGTYNITYETVQNGSISGDATAHNTETVTVIATPNANYHLTTMTYSYGGNTYDATVSGNTGSFTMPASDVTVSATFELIAANTAEFVNGVYTETLLSQTSFDNWYAYSVSGEQAWEYRSGYGAYMSGHASSTNTNHANEDWFISPTMTVTNGKLDIDFECVGRYGEEGMITVYYSKNYLGIGDPTSSEWTQLTPETAIPYANSNWNFMSISLTIEDASMENIHFAFKYVSTDDKAGTFEFKNFSAKQYYTITLNQNQHGTISSSPESKAVVGGTVSLTATPNDGYLFGEWTVLDGDANAVTVTDNTFTMPASNVEVEASFIEPQSYDVFFTSNGVTVSTLEGVYTVTEFPAISNVPTGFNLVGWTANTSTMELATLPYTLTEDVEFYAVFQAPKAYTFTITPADFNTTSYAANNGSHTSTARATDGSMMTVTWVSNQVMLSGGYMQWQSGKGYIYNTTSLGSISDVTLTIEAGSFNTVIGSIQQPTEIVENGAYFKTSVGNATGKTSDLTVSFTGGPYYINVFQNVTVTGNIAINGPSIIPSGSILNMGEYTLTNTLGAAKLVIEDGAQYIGNSVEATMQKNITACVYSDQNNAGYNLIASPIYDELTAANVNGLLTTDYDLYKFDNTAELEWLNYKANTFTIDPEVGYLYASGSNTVIEFAGELTENPSTGLYEVTVAHEGFNLIGNPLTYNAIAVNGDAEVVDFQVLTSNGGSFEASSDVIAPCEAILVQTASDEEIVYFVDPSFLEDVNAVNINLVENDKKIDNVRVRFGQGRGMNKFYLNNNNSRVYFQQGNEEMAVVRSVAEAEMPVSFKASKNGTYTLAIETENVEMNYLHLIDNLTGMDVDLLQTPSYTFDAKTSDYASRFRLVFKANGTNENNAETFAYFNGTNWTVSNVGDATLQVVDVTGRTVANQMINGNAELNLNQPAGVYVIRLVNGDNVKTQKVVVR